MEYIFGCSKGGGIIRLMLDAYQPVMVEISGADQMTLLRGKCKLPPQNGMCDVKPLTHLDFCISTQRQWLRTISSVLVLVHVLLTTCSSGKNSRKSPLCPLAPNQWCRHLMMKIFRAPLQQQIPFLLWQLQVQVMSVTGKTGQTGMANGPRNLNQR